MRFQIYSRWTIFGRRWHWRLVAANNRIVAQGDTSGYHNKGDCVDAIEHVRETGLKTMVEDLG